MFSKIMLPHFGVPEVLIFTKYLKTDLAMKVYELRNSYQIFKNILLNSIYNNLSIESVVSFFNVYKKKGMLTVNIIHVTCRELIERFINSVTIIVENTPSFDTIPIGIIYHKNKTLNFAHLNKLYLYSLSDIQLTLYSIMINFYSNIQIFAITNDAYVENMNKKINVFLVWIIRFILLNIGLTVLLCIGTSLMIIMANKLGNVMIVQMSNKIENLEFYWYMNKKIKNLILLNNLYEENLQTIITNIEKEKHNQIQRIKNLYAKKESLKLFSN